MKTRNVILFILGSVLLLSSSLWLHRSPPAQVVMQTEAIVPALNSQARVAEKSAPEAIEARQKHHASKDRPHSAAGPKASHRPEQPKSGQAVLITLEFKGQPVPGGGVILEYQTVDPGKYIALRDPAFTKQWTALPMIRGTSESLLSAEVPGSVQQHRRLIRYRFRSVAENKVFAPDAADPQPNFAYFVYDGVPAWKGAINPRSGDARLREPVTHSSESLERVPVYHFISSKAAVEKVTWSNSDQYGDGSRNSYKYTGTMVYDGVVYDHIGFRARGGGWRHAMGKNMWKFNFLPGHRFEARDDYGAPYRAKWDKLNLGACIQQGDYGMRGEQGMFEAVGFRLFNLAGIEAPRTHWVHFRIIDEAEESPASQYSGDFWGLYLAVENVDEHFLKEHSLPAGNVYKIEGGPKTAFNGNQHITDQADVNEFMRALMRRQQPDSWWAQNVDLPRYYNYRAIIECIHHYDLDGGKNYFYYDNPESGKWAVVPWDIDLTWADSMFGGGQEPFYRTGLLFRDPFRTQYQERLAELRDLLFNPEETGKLIDEHAAFISDGRGGPSLVDADRRKWDYHPVLASGHSMSMKAGQGLFYFGNSKNTFQEMVKYMKSYVARRSAWIDRQLLRGYQPPPQPRILRPGALNFAAGPVSFELEPSQGTPPRACRWRLAEITDPKSAVFNPKQPWKYEIQPLWEQEAAGLKGPGIPANLLVPGHTYRVRARNQNETGAWSRWSVPVQFTVASR